MVNFGCFTARKFSHFHCNAMRKVIKAHKNLHTNQQNEHIQGVSVTPKNRHISPKKQRINGKRRRNFSLSLLQSEHSFTRLSMRLLVRVVNVSQNFLLNPHLKNFLVAKPFQTLIEKFKTKFKTSQDFLNFRRGVCTNISKFIQQIFNVTCNIPKNKETHKDCFLSLHCWLLELPYYRPQRS